MLLKKTTLKSSLIPGAGLGCFAAEFIPKGSVIWEFNPLIDRVFAQSEIDQCTELEQSFLNTYCYKYNGLYFLCVDNGRFFNHSDDPNTSEESYSTASFTRQATIASKDINIGDEIVSNYAHFGITPADTSHNVIVVPEQVYIDRRTNDYIH
jgi:uncharacterized protein